MILPEIATDRYFSPFPFLDDDAADLAFNQRGLRSSLMFVALEQKTAQACAGFGNCWNAFDAISRCLLVFFLVFPVAKTHRLWENVDVIIE